MADKMADKLADFGERLRRLRAAVGAKSPEVPSTLQRVSRTMSGPMPPTVGLRESTLDDTVKLPAAGVGQAGSQTLTESPQSPIHATPASSSPMPPAPPVDSQGGASLEPCSTAPPVPPVDSQGGMQVGPPAPSVDSQISLDEMSPPGHSEPPDGSLRRAEPAVRGQSIQTDRCPIDMEMWEATGPLDVIGPMDHNALQQTLHSVLSLERSMVDLNLKVMALQADQQLMQQQHNRTGVAHTQTLRELRQAIDAKSECECRHFKELLQQNTQYLRVQITDTLKWRLNKLHIDILQDLQDVMTPMATTITQLQEETLTCSQQLHHVVEDITFMKQNTHSMNRTFSHTAVQAAQSDPSTVLPTMVRARPQLQSTMHVPRPDQASSPVDSSEQRGRFMGKTPIKLQFPCFGRMEDCSDPLLYVEKCNDYLSLNPLSDEEILATMSCVLHGTARDWWDVTRLETHSWKEFENKFLFAFLSEDYMDELEERVRTQVQGEDESIRDFAYRYRSLCRRWKTDITEAKVIQLLLKNIRPQLACQLRSSRVSSVDELVRLGQQLEKDWGKQLQQQLRNPADVPPAHSAVRTSQVAQQPSSSQATKPSEEAAVFCWRCKGSHPPYSCPQWKPKKKSGNNQPQQSPANENNPTLSSMSNQQPVSAASPFSSMRPFPQQLFVGLTIGLVDGRAMVDTGSSYTLLTEEVWHTVKADHAALTPWTGSPLYLADGGGRWPLGWQEMTLTVQGHPCTLPVVVLSSEALACPVVLGLDFMCIIGLQIDMGSRQYWFNANKARKYSFEKDMGNPARWGWKGQLGFFSAVNPRSTKPSPEATLDAELLRKVIEGAQMDAAGKSRLFNQLQENADVCTSRLGCTGVLTHKILVTQGMPIKQRPYRLPPAKLQVMKELIEEMLEMDIIEPSSSAWSSPVVLIPRKDRKPRFCVNYIKLNAVTYTDAYPLPTIQEILDSLAGSVIFSSIDLNNGYWQCRMDQDSIDKTAFASPLGLFQFKVMPFGLKNAPATFQRLMEMALGELRGSICFVYLDDIIIHSASPEQHYRDIQAVLDKLRAAHLTVNMKKSKFFQTSLRFLGHVVSAAGIQVDSEKVKAVEDFPVPTNLKAVQRFLGMSGWYHRFVPNFSGVADPLNNLKRKGVKFRWTPECQHSFETLKNHLVSPPILGHPNFQLPFVVYTDASDVGLGAVLVQQTGLGSEEVLAYGSRSLNKAERNYSATEKECLAVVWALEKWRYYLECRPFKVVTDHSSLVWMFKSQKASARLTLWVLRLQEFTFTIEYRKGKYNTVPDALSRAPSDLPLEELTEVATMMSVKGEPHRELPITDEEIWKAQQGDPEIQRIYGSVMGEGELTVSESIKFTILEDKVYRVVQLPYKTIYQVYIPECLRKPLLQMFHDDPISGHLGRYKTYKRMHPMAYWPGMSLEVKSYVQNCETCQKFKPESRKVAGKLQQTVVEHPWEMIGVDFMGPFPRSTKGNVYLAVFVDYFTRWVELYPLRKATAETVSRVLTEEILTRWGVPHFILSDQGSQFVSAVFRETCAKWNLRQKLTTAYHPQTNLTERVNRTLKTMIASYVTNHKHWDKHLPAFRFALNSAVHESTGVTPAELNLGRTLRSPLDVTLRPWTPTPDGPTYKCMTELKELQEFVRVNLEKGRIRQKRNYDKKRRDLLLKDNDRVWLRSHPYSKAEKSFTAKLAPKWLGPYRVISQVGPVNVDVVLEESGEDRKVVHVSRLKPCYPTAEELEKADRKRIMDLFEEDSEEEEFLGFPSAEPEKSDRKRIMDLFEEASDEEEFLGFPSAEPENKGSPL